MNLFASFLKCIFATTYVGVFFLRIFHYGFIYRNPGSILGGCIPPVIISSFLVLCVSICEYKILSPFVKIVNSYKKTKAKISQSDSEKCIEAYKKFDIAIAIGEGVGFLLGAGSTSIVESLTGAIKFDPLLFCIIIAQAIGVGYICYTFIVFRIKKILMTQMLRDLGIEVNVNLSKTLSIAIADCIYISIINMITVPIGFFLKPEIQNKFHLFLMDSLIGGILTGAVCILTYSLLIKKIKETEKYVSSKLYYETLNLATATKESAATSMEQSTAVKEIVATVEDTNNLSMNIKDKVQSVTKLTEQAKDDVLSGVEYLEKNIKELLVIMENNKNTMEGIRELGIKINNIWEVVTLINDVASQAKIIAFNAELEANSAGEYGKNFHIVASEVRRLSDNIIDGTKEIKEKIGEIQNASDTLVSSTEQSADRINSEYENIKSLQLKFSKIKDSAEYTAKSSNDITDFFVQLAASNEQIYSTIKQIAYGIENFSQTTESISSTSQNVKELAKLL